MRFGVPAFAGLFLLVACGGGGSATASPSPTKTPSISFSMVSMNGSGASGTGKVVKASGSFTVTIKLTRLVPNSSHISHIHNGSCSKPGGIAYALSQVLADASGNATATSTVQVDYSVPPTGWYVNVHHGPDFSVPANGPSISCGDLPQS